MARNSKKQRLKYVESRDVVKSTRSVKRLNKNKNRKVKNLEFGLLKFCFTGIILINIITNIK